MWKDYIQSIFWSWLPQSSISNSCHFSSDENEQVKIQIHIYIGISYPEHGQEPGVSKLKTVKPK